MERFLHPAGSSRGRLDTIRHLFHFFLFLFFNLAAGERSGLVIDVAVSKPDGEPQPPPWVPYSHSPESQQEPNLTVGA